MITELTPATQRLNELTKEAINQALQAIHNEEGGANYKEQYLILINDLINNSPIKSAKTWGLMLLVNGANPFGVEQAVNMLT